MRKFKKSDIQFKVDNKEIKFSIIHDMPSTFGLSFDDAFTNWIGRTREYTDKSLCKYIMSKKTGYIAMTEEEWNSIKTD